jgi:hypothetical protein
MSEPDELMDWGTALIWGTVIVVVLLGVIAVGYLAVVH